MKAVTSIKQIMAVEPYRITCLFQNGQIKTVDLESLLEANPTHVLLREFRRKRYFIQVILDEIGGLCWPNGFDYSPRSAFAIGY